MIDGSGINRRDFLKGAGSTVLSLSLVNLGCREEPQETVEKVVAGPFGRGAVDYRDFQDLYRKKWTWDSVSKGTHYVNCWYQARCNWNVYVKEGVVFREEQVAAYPQTNPDV
ncbi:MAG: twin-arginine translocation signal domain-containing protein, partial [candidate division NC10 bacterium]